MTPKQRVAQTLTNLRPLLTTDWQADDARVTDAVVTAVDEALAEIRRPRTNWYAVATLLSCKSYLCGALVEGEPFCEDRDHNELVLGEGGSVYTVLDGAQFAAAMLADVLPAGMTAYTAQGKAEERYPTDDESATMQSIAIAHDRVLRTCAIVSQRASGE